MPKRKPVDPKADLYPECPFEVAVVGLSGYENPAMSREVAEKIKAHLEMAGYTATIREKPKA